MPLNQEKKRLFIPNNPKRSTISGKLIDTLQDSEQQKWFQKFLIEEDGNENILFWLAVERLKKATDESQISEQNLVIWDEFLNEKSCTCINLPPDITEPIEKAIENQNFSSTLYNVAQEEIFNLLKVDPFPRFLQSCYYTGMYKSQEKENTESSLIPDGVFDDILKNSNLKIDNGWGQPLFQKQALSIHKKLYTSVSRETSQGFTVLRTHLLIRSRSSHVFSILKNIKRRREWDDLFQDGFQIESLGTDVEVLYMSWKGSALEKGKDYCLLSIGREKKRDLKDLKDLKNLTESEYGDLEEKIWTWRSVVHRECPQKKGFVRGEIEMGAFVMKDVGLNECELTHFLQVEGKVTKSHIERSFCFKALRNIAEIEYLKSQKIPFSIEYKEPKKVKKQKVIALRNRHTITIKCWNSFVDTTPKENENEKGNPNSEEGWISSAPKRKPLNEKLIIGRKIQNENSNLKNHSDSLSVLAPLSSEYINALDLQSDEKNPNDCPFFWNQLGRSDSELILRNQSCDCFLLRPSSREGCVALTVYTKNEDYITHCLLEKKPEGYIFSEEENAQYYPTLTAFCLEEPDLHKFFPLSNYSEQPAHIQGRTARGSNFRPGRFKSIPDPKEAPIESSLWNQTSSSSVQHSWDNENEGIWTIRDDFNNLGENLSMNLAESLKSNQNLTFIQTPQTMKSSSFIVSSDTTSSNTKLLATSLHEKSLSTKSTNLKLSSTEQKLSNSIYKNRNQLNLHTSLKNLPKLAAKPSPNHPIQIKNSSSQQTQLIRPQRLQREDKKVNSSYNFNDNSNTQSHPQFSSHTFNPRIRGRTQQRKQFSSDLRKELNEINNELLSNEDSPRELQLPFGFDQKFSDFLAQAKTKDK